MTRKQRIRQWTFPFLASLTVLLGMSAGVLANGGSGLPDWGESAKDGLKGGPLGLNPTLDAGQVPVAIRIDDANVDAEVEQQEIVDGQMLDPSGPWVVSWYKQTAMIGSRGNTVMSGHVDYWDVGPSVFWDVAKLQEGDQINVVGDDGTTYVYAVEYIERVIVADLTPERLNSPELVGKTDYPALTLITCGGDFNGTEYLSRDIIRSRLVETVAADGTATQEEKPSGDEASKDTGSADAGSGKLAEGGTATISDSGVNLRSEPSTSADAVSTLDAGTTVTITGPSQDAEGFTWWPIKLEDGTTGWVVEDFLTPAG